MLKNLLNNSLKAVVLTAFAVGACAAAQAQTEALYLSDVQSEEELTSDVFGVPMRIDNVGDYLYVARYYNKEANTPIYFLADKTTFENAYGLLDGDLAFGTVAELDPIVLPEANTYYEINLDVDNFEYSIATYEPADYMDPIIFEQGSNSLNTWWAWENTGEDDWVGADAWWQEFYIGVMTNNPENVIRFDVDENNPHLYRTAALPIADFTNDDGMEEGRINLAIHNWHSHGWWNYCTWRCDDDKTCERFMYYGGVVKQAYLDWVYGEGNVSWSDWANGEDYRKQFVPDNWCHAAMPAEGNFMLEFDSHLGRAKLVPATAESSISPVINTTNEPAVYYNIQGQRMNGKALTPGLYIMRQGNNAQKVLVK